MIARVGFFENFDFEDREYVVETVWAMPGFLGIHHLVDPAGGPELSVSLWSDNEHAEPGPWLGSTCSLPTSSTT